VAEGQRAALARALLATGAAPALAVVRDTLVLAGMTNPAPATYAALAQRARHADSLGYAVLQ
jgi:hypothetical protein